MELTDGLKKIFLAGVGAVATTAESTKDVVNKLVEKGELTVEQGKVLNEELKHSTKEKVKDHVTVNIVKEYKDVLNAVDSMDEEDRDALRKKLDEADAKAAQKKKANTEAENKAEANSKTSAESKEAKAEKCAESASATASDSCGDSEASASDSEKE